MGKTVANILTLFFSQPSQIPGRASGVTIFAKLRCLVTAQSRYRRTDRQTDGRRSDLSSAAYYLTLAEISKTALIIYLFIHVYFSDQILLQCRHCDVNSILRIPTSF